MLVVLRASSEAELQSGMAKVNVARHIGEEGISPEDSYGLGCSPLGSLVTSDGDTVITIKLTEEEFANFPEYFDPESVLIDYDPVTRVPGDEEGELVPLDWPRYTVVDPEGNEFKQAAGYVE